MENQQRKKLIESLRNITDSEIWEFHKQKNKTIPDKLYRYRGLSSQEEREQNLQTLFGDYFKSLGRKHHVVWLSDPKCFDNEGQEVDTQISFRDEIIQKYILFQLYRKELVKYLGMESAIQFHENILRETTQSDEILQYQKSELSRRIAEDSKIPDRELYFNQLQEKSTELIPYCKKKNRDRITNGLAVACFSETKYSDYMWKHYAADGNGFCLEYDMTRLRLTDCQRYEMYPVRYQDEPTDLDRLLKPDYDRQAWSSQILMAILTKKTQYHKEKEWRFVLGNCGYDKNEDGTEKRGLTFPFIKPTTIYLGPNISEDNKNRLLNIGQKLGIRIGALEKNSEPDSYRETIIHEPDPALNRLRVNPPL
ncbi:MAG TPA: DUF2971 domain-containing protein [Methanocorpusculum sp.]|nr:DUF2971 domain-containing protein [Methanocorpusculum sp.]